MKLPINSQTLTVSPWRFGKGYTIDPTLYKACNYLSLVGLKLNHPNKSGHYRENILLLWNKTLIFFHISTFYNEVPYPVSRMVWFNSEVGLGVETSGVGVGLRVDIHKTCLSWRKCIISKLRIWKLSPTYVISHISDPIKTTAILLTASWNAFS